MTFFLTFPLFSGTSKPLLSGRVTKLEEILYWKSAIARSMSLCCASQSVGVITSYGLLSASACCSRPAWPGRVRCGARRCPLAPIAQPAGNMQGLLRCAHAAPASAHCTAQRARSGSHTLHTICMASTRTLFSPHAPAARLARAHIHGLDHWSNTGSPQPCPGRGGRVH